MSDTAVTQRVWESKGHKLELIDDEKGKPAGFVWTHKRQEYENRSATGGRWGWGKLQTLEEDCIGFVDLRTVHKVREWDKLTIDPSLACATCDCHGFWRDGWTISLWESKGWSSTKHAVWRITRAGKDTFRLVFTGRNWS